MHEIHKEQSVPYVVAFARSEAAGTLVPFDGASWYLQYAITPKKFFENNTYTKVYFLALVTLGNDVPFTSYLGTVKRDDTTIPDYTARYVMASTCCKGAPQYIENLLRYYTSELDPDEIGQFAAALLRHRPSNQVAYDTLMNYIRESVDDDEAFDRAHMVCSIADRLHNSMLYKGIIEVLIEHVGSEKLIAIIHSVLNKCQAIEPHNSRVPCLLGTIWLNQPGGSNVAWRYFMNAKVAEPDMPLPYLGFATILFQSARPTHDDITLAKTCLDTFLKLGLQKKYTETSKIEVAQVACALLRAHLNLVTPKELSQFVQQIHSALPDFDEGFPLLVAREAIK
jgi:hypothetical protein